MTNKKQSLVIRRHKEFTCSDSPAPIKLLTKELDVDANALINMKMIDDMLRTTLVMASGRSPKCSTATKKINQLQ